MPRSPQPVDVGDDWLSLRNLPHNCGKLKCAGSLAAGRIHVQHDRPRERVGGGLAQRLAERVIGSEAENVAEP